MRGFRLLANENGGLTKATFRTALAFFDQKAGYESIHAMAKSPHLSDHLFDVFDSDGNGEIDLNEFTVGLLSLVTGSKRDKVRSLFQMCDLDASGEIDHGEFYQLLHFLHIELPKARRAPRAARRERVRAVLTSTRARARQARQALDLNTGEDTNSIAQMSEKELDNMATAIIQTLDLDGNGESHDRDDKRARAEFWSCPVCAGEISLDELMAWFDSYPDADVTDLFSLLRSVVDSAPEAG